MKPVPIKITDGYSTAKPSSTLGIRQPIAISSTPQVIGFTIPMRSTRRPIGTASIIGNSANKAISVPTVNSDACSDSAYSEVVTREPASATWAAIETRIS